MKNASNLALFFLGSGFALYRGYEFFNSREASCLLSAIYGALVGYCAIIRKPPTQINSTVGCNLIVFFHVAVPFFFMPADAVKIKSAGVILGIFASIGAAWALADLGRSFGLRPALRNLVNEGAYRWVRHPMYLFYLLNSVAMTMVFGVSVYNTLVFGLILGLTVFRISKEESLLLKDPGYRKYTDRTKFKLIPGIY